MRLTFAKLLSILVVSGNGQQCNVAICEVRDWGFSIDPKTNKTKTSLIKFGISKNRADFIRMGQEMYKILHPRLDDIEDHFIGPDNIENLN